jgi:hypothetical protein
MLAAAVALLAAVVPAAALAGERLRVDPDAGNNTFSAVFDAKLGERITATSAAVACDTVLDVEAGTVSGTCSVPLTSIVVDNEPTKTEHFRQWATNKKSAPEACRLEARFEGVKLGKLAPEVPAPFTAEVPFTVCGRARADGKPERLTGTAVLFPPGSYGDAQTLRIRATVAGFDREAYHVGPAWTEGWLARVQTLAKVVAPTGTVELSLFARAAPAPGSPAASSK